MANQPEEAAPRDGSPLDDWVRTRRAALEEQAGGDLPPPPAPGDPVWGLAFSGGGIRSATFCLGVTSGLASKRVFHRFDLLSTVSGGGYIGAALGKLFNERGASATAIEAGLATPGASWFIWWLRATSRYLTPRGAKDLLWAAASYGRNMLAVHLELALGLMAVGALLALVDLGTWKVLYDWFSRNPDEITSLGKLFQPWVSTLWLFMLLPLAAGIPLLAAYWSVPSRPGTRRVWHDVRLAVVHFLAAAVLGFVAARGREIFEAVHQGLLVFCGATSLLFVLTGFAPIVARLAKPRRQPTQAPADDAADPAPLADRLRRLMQGMLSATLDTGTQAEQRNRLTRWLTWCLTAALVLLALGALDRVAWFVAFEHKKYAYILPLAIAMGLAMTRALAARLPTHDPAAATSGRLLFKLAEFFGLLLFALLAIFWVAVVYRVAMVNLFAPDPLDQLEFRNALLLVLAFLGVPLLLMLLTRKNADFSNLSSLHMFYRARLSRSYLGAANRKRFQVVPPGGGAPVAADPLSAVDVQAMADAAKRPSVFEVDPGDAVSMARYRPHGSGGPVHIINVTVNQTHDPMGGLFNQDRKGQYLSVTSEGYHRVGLDRWRQGDAYQAAQLPAWMAISGAAFGPGLGGQTSTGMAVLLFLAGVRLGYWWESDKPENGWRAQLSATKYQLLYGEAFASFGGIDDRFWYLSDGGHFENSGAYALLREGSRLVVLVDGAADPSYQYEDLENLVRKARIDLQVEIEFVDVDATGDERLALFGSLDQLGDPTSSACIALARVRYPKAPQGWLVYVKPNIFGGLPIDLINYKRDNPAFPQEPTTDQFFSESQWESYYRLGRELGLQLEGRLLHDIVAEDPAFMARLAPARAQPGQPAAADSKDGKSLPFTVRYPRATSLAKSGLSLTALLAVLAAANDSWDKFADERARRRNAYNTELQAISLLHERLAAKDDKVLPELIAKFGGLASNYCRGDESLRPVEPQITEIYNEVASRCEGRRDDHGQPLLTPVCKTLVTQKARSCFAGGQRLGQPVYWAVAYDDPAWARDRVVAEPAEAQVVLAAPPPPPPLPPTAPDRGPAAVQATAPGACNGKVVYLQVYDEAGRDKAGSLATQLKEMGATVRGVENVVATAARDGRTPPRPVAATTAVYHTGEDGKCADAMKAISPELVSRQLARGMVATRGVVEVWLPPQVATEKAAPIQKKS